MTRPRFSVVACISDINVYDSCLLNSIKRARGNHQIEIIPIYNMSNVYSASSALNIGIDVSKSDFVIFAHQDVSLLGDWFTILENVISSIDGDWGVIGSAGIALKYGRTDIGRWGGSIDVRTVAVGSVWDNENNLNDPPYWDGLKELSKVHCVDECLLVLNKRSGLRFDNSFNGFHFYGADICLQARAAAYPVYAADLPIIHHGQHSSSFAGDRRYWRYLRLLHNKWNARFPELLGTHMHWAPGELTSYIPISVESDDGCGIVIKAVGIENAMIEGDR